MRTVWAILLCVLAMSGGQVSALRQLAAWTTQSATPGLTSTTQSLLYGTHPTDPLTLVSASIGLLATVLIAAVLPATRAVRIRPATALRME